MVLIHHRAKEFAYSLYRTFFLTHTHISGQGMIKILACTLMLLPQNIIIYVHLKCSLYMFHHKLFLSELTIFYSQKRWVKFAVNGIPTKIYSDILKKVIKRFTIQCGMY